MRFFNILLAIVIVLGLFACQKAKPGEKEGFIPADETEEAEIPTDLLVKESVVGRWTIEGDGWVELRLDDSYLMDNGDMGAWSLSDQQPQYIKLESDEETREYRVRMTATGSMDWVNEQEPIKHLTKTTKAGI